ncbi:MAG: 3-dehydroquinate synthase family protein, partial [Candidatus Cloacimonadaceae bacterium]|nr:3-dehydroquinate synthase family protein [Candidatus Cloacimonadaceae bacterium]
MQSISFPCPVPLCEIRHANVSSYLHEYCSGRKVAIITDESVAKLYRHLMPDGLIISIPAGESSKSLSMVESIIGKLIDGGCGRDVLLIGFGGGVVTDICGLVASIYLRGVDFGLVPTTLLAQIDAAIGGKTGVNHGSLKNMIGTFRLPGFVICDPLFLETLTQADYLSGLAELVKTALV